MSARRPGKRPSVEAASGRAPDLPARRDPGRTFVLAAALALAVIVAHLPALGAGALALDDDAFVARNALVQRPSWESARRFFTELTHPSTVSAYYLPLSMTSLMLDWAAGGRPDHLRPFHVTSLALHTASALLLFLILRRLFGAELVAAVVALAWAIHPVMVEAIASAGERKTVLATTFALATVYAHVRFALGRRRAWWTASVGLFLLALLSKPSAISLPLALLVIDAWPLRRLSHASLLEKWPHAVLAAAAGIVSLLAVRNTWEFGAPPPLDPPRVLAQVLWLQGFYLGKLVWPVPLSTVYAAPERFVFTRPDVVLPMLAALALLVGALILRRRAPALLAGGSATFVLLAPTFAILRYSQVIAYDRYLHLPTAGISLVLAAALGWLATRAGGAARGALVTALVLSLGAEALATRLAWRPWRDTLSLWQQAVRVSPGVPDAWNGLGVTYSAAGSPEQAIEALRHAIAVGPNYADAHYNLGREYMVQGRIDEALPLLEFAVAHSPGSALDQLELGVAYQRAGRLPDAEQRYRRALELRAGYVPALIQLGQVEAMQHREAHGIALLREALRRSPGEPLASYVLAGVLHERSGAHDESVALLEQAAAGKPHWAEPLDDLASELAELGRFDEAVAAAERALVLAREAGDSPRVAGLEARLVEYARGRPLVRSPRTSH